MNEQREKPIGCLPSLTACAWSNHAKTTLRGVVDGVAVTFAECSGNGLPSDTNEVHAASIVRACNHHNALVAALDALVAPRIGHDKKRQLAEARENARAVLARVRA